MGWRARRGSPPTPRSLQRMDVVTMRRAERAGRRTAPTSLLMAIVLMLLTSIGIAAPAAGSPPPTDPTTQNADDTGSFAVQPSGPNGPGGRDYFVYTLKTGEVFGDVVGISNLSSETKSYAIYATDALNTSDGGFTLLKEGEKPKDVGNWVEIGATQYTLDPGQRADIPFKITVPADATPGDHVGAIVAQEIPDTVDPIDSGIGVDLRVRIGARIYLRVDGPVTPSLSVGSFTIDYDTPASPFAEAPAKITYVVTNTGNVRLAPTAKLKISGLFGSVSRHSRTAPSLSCSPARRWRSPRQSRV